MSTILLFSLLFEQAIRSGAPKAKDQIFLRCEQSRMISFKGDVSTRKVEDVYIRFNETGDFASGSIDEMAWRLPPADATKLVTARVMKFDWMEAASSGEKVLSRTLELDRASGTFKDTTINRINLGTISVSGPCTRLTIDPFSKSVNKF